jgi:hypothetical protein
MMAVSQVFGARVSVGPVPASIDEPVIDLPGLTATSVEAVLGVGGIGRFHVRGGRLVRIAPVPGVSPSTLETLLHGTVAGLVLVQRRRFALHASTIRLGDQLVAIAGASGAGKSTTVGVLARRGHAIVADEVTALVPRLDPATGAKTVTAQGSGGNLRLWRSAAERLGLAEEDGVKICGGKHAYPFEVSRWPGRLGLVIALRIAAGTGPGDDGAGAITPVRLGGVDAVQALLADTYRPVLQALHPEAYLRWAATVAGAVPVVQINRPPDGWTGDEVAAAVELAAGLS